MTRRHLFLIATLLLTATFGRANAPPAPPVSDQSRPELAVQALFEVAQNRTFISLWRLCDPQHENDGDTDCLCALSTRYTPQQCDADSGNRMSKDDFNTYFAKAEVQGEARIEGDRAEVDFLFGPGNTRKETMNLVKRGELWYLLSF